MEFNTTTYQLTVIAEDAYTAQSTDNVRAHNNEYRLDETSPPSNCYGITCAPHGGSCVILAGGGTSALTERSAIISDSSAWLAIGDEIVCLELPSLKLRWHKKLDGATCFEIFLAPDGKALLVHGELDISKVTYEGEIIWSSSGKDIFTGDFVVHSDHILATDFNGEKYRVDINTGVTNLIKV